MFKHTSHPTPPSRICLSSPIPLHTLKLPQLRLRAVATSLCAEMKLRCRPENGASCPVLVVVRRERVNLCLQPRTSSEVLDSPSAFLAVVADLRWDAARLGSYISGLVMVGRGGCVAEGSSWYGPSSSVALSACLNPSVRIPLMDVSS